MTTFPGLAPETGFLQESCQIPDFPGHDAIMTSFEEGCQPDRVGSPLSIRSLSEDLQVAHQTVARWLTMLEKLYVCFRIPPFGAPRIRAVKKETKLYLWDWSQVPGQGERFENLVACHLLKYCHHQEDTEGYRMELRFIRDTDRREVDFIVLRDKVSVDFKLRSELEFDS